VKLEDVSGYEDLELLVKEAMSGPSVGRYHSPFHGYSVEFAQHKSYSPGESIRHLDWKLLARTEKPYIKVYNAETNLKALLWMDVSPSMYFPEKEAAKVRFSVFLNACLTHALQKGRDGVGLVEWRQSDMSISDVRSSAQHRHKLMGLLETYWNSWTPTPAVASHFRPLNWAELVQQSGRRSLVVISSDLEFDPSQPQEREQFIQALGQLRHQHCEVVLFHIQHGQMEVELNLPTARPTRFVDLESGMQIKLNPLSFQQAYRQQLQTEIAQWKQLCLEMGIDYQWVDASDHVEIPIKAFYAKRNALFR